MHGRTQMKRTEEEIQFVQTLVANKQAAEEVDGKLPKGATHAIIGYDENGVPIVVRRRFHA
jgi:hypothetical protein